MPSTGVVLDAELYVNVTVGENDAIATGVGATMVTSIWAVALVPKLSVTVMVKNVLPIVPVDTPEMLPLVLKLKPVVAVNELSMLYVKAPKPPLPFTGLNGVTVTPRVYE